MGREKKYIDDYDYEESYKKSLKDLEQDQIDRYMKEGRKGAAYQTKTTKAGDQLEADIYPVFGSRKDAPRAKRGNKSRPAQKSLNSRRARRHLNNLVSANFGRGDLWCTFTCDDAHLPKNLDDAVRLFRNFIRRVNRKRNKAGLGNAKYICVIEYSEEEGKKTRCHYHVIMSGDMNRDELEKQWTQGKRNQTRRIDPDPDTHAAGIVSYISKDPKGRKRWISSKNLKKPVVTKSICRFGKRTAERMAADRAYLESRIKKSYPGYRFIDAEVRINDVNGGFYIYARMARIRGNSRGNKGDSGKEKGGSNNADNHNKQNRGQGDR